MLTGRPASRRSGAACRPIKGLDADSSNTQVKEALERCLAAAAALPSDAPAAKAKGNEAYKNGQYEEAAKWYCEAATQGHVNAQFNLAALYSTGRGVAKSDEEAMKWFQTKYEGIVM